MVKNIQFGLVFGSCAAVTHKYMCAVCTYTYFGNYFLFI